MRKKVVLIIPVILVGIITSLVLLSLVSAGIEDVGPDIYSPNANPSEVNIGVQPEDSPLIVSVKVGTGGDISTITANFDDFSGAKYYDPSSNIVQDASRDTPLNRVYLIEGEEAYLINVGSRYEYNEYMTAVTHKILRGDAIATSKWQVELPDVGYNLSVSGVDVTAVNIASHSSNIEIPLEIVVDYKAPDVAVEAKYLINSPVTRIGDVVIIEAREVYDLSGVFSIRLAQDDAEEIFGENADLDLVSQVNSDIWSVSNEVSSNASPGIYRVQVVATDRTGNRANEIVEIEVAEEITTFLIDLEKGWNLISVPRALRKPALEAVFSGTPIVNVQTVLGGERLEPSEIIPGRGYLVEVTEDMVVSVEFADYNLSEIPLTMNLNEGWNLIGYASQNLEPVMPLTYYLGADLKDEWLIVYTDTGATARAKSTSPYVWADDSFSTITGEPYSDDSDNLPSLQLGKGYWIYITGEGIFIP